MARAYGNLRNETKRNEIGILRNTASSENSFRRGGIISCRVCRFYVFEFVPTTTNLVTRHLQTICSCNDFVKITISCRVSVHCSDSCLKAANEYSSIIFADFSLLLPFSIRRYITLFDEARTNSESSVKDEVLARTQSYSKFSDMSDPDESCVWRTLILSVLIQFNILTKAYAGETMTVDACFNKLETVFCGTSPKPNGVNAVEWKVYNTKEKRWIYFSYCKKLQGCSIKKKSLSNGITVENISMTALTVKASVKHNIYRQSRLLCQVHHEDSVAYDEVEINFTECITAEKGTDVNLTKVFQEMLPWEKVKYLFIENSDGSKLAYCDTGSCIKENGNSFWNRLEVKKGSLIFSEVMESDDGLEFKIKVDLRKGFVRGSIGTTRVYSIKIFVISSSVSGSTSEPPATMLSTSRRNKTSHPPVTYTVPPTRSGASATQRTLLISILIPTMVVCYVW